MNFLYRYKYICWILCPNYLSILYLSIQGSLEHGRDGPVFMTIHNVGQSFQSMVEFVNHEDMADVKQRSEVKFEVKLMPGEVRGQG